jgi:hypothetical protein
MRFILFIAFSFSISLAASPIAFGETGWTHYRNDRFGTMADVPAGWKMGAAPENNDGRVFTSPDDAATLIISGSLNTETDLAAAFKTFETPNKGETITYKQRVGRAIIVSGTTTKDIFYGKHLLSCRNQIWNSVYLEYPAAQKATYDPIVARVAKSLRAGPGYQIANCKK